MINKLLILTAFLCLITLPAFAQKVELDCSQEYNDYGYSYYSILKWMNEIKTGDHAFPVCHSIDPENYTDEKFKIWKDITDKEMANAMETLEYLIRHSKNMSDDCKSDVEAQNQILKDITNSLQKRQKEKKDLYEGILSNPRFLYSFDCDDSYFNFYFGKIMPEKFPPDFLYQFSKGHSQIVVSENWNKEKSFTKFENAWKFLHGTDISKPLLLE